MKKMYLLLLLQCSSLIAFSQTIIARWTFETSQPSTAGPITPESGSGNAYVNTSGSVSNPTGNGSAESFASTGWAIGDYFQFEVSTTGLSNIAVAFDQYGGSTGAGPAAFKLQYSNDGVTFYDLTNGNYTIPNSSTWVTATRYYQYNLSFDLSAITALNNQANIYIRLTNTSTVAVNGGNITGSGRAYVDNVIITAGTSAYYYSGAGDISDVANWGTNINGTGTNPPSLLIGNNTYHIGNNTNIVCTTNIGFGGAVFLDANTTFQLGNSGIGGGTFALNNSASLDIAATSHLAFGTTTSKTPTYNFRNRPVILHSDASGTATIKNLNNGALAEATNVTAERYIPAKRAWRLLSIPLVSTGAPSIFNSWQENGSSISGYGTWITNTTTGNGYDGASTTPSIKYYDGITGNLLTPTATNTGTITDNGGAYFLFIRGDRSVTGSGTPNITTLRTTGTINKGTINNVGIANSSFSLIPNPYPSSVDYENIYSGNGSNQSTFYIWDANAGSIGGYRTIVRNGTTLLYEATPSTGNVTDDNSLRYIASGQAFFVPGSVTFNFTESMKTPSVANASVFKTTTNEEELVGTLKANTSNGYVVADGFRIKYDAGYSNTILTGEDIPKISNFSENLSILNNMTDLVIEKRALPATTDTIQLRFWNTALNSYELSFAPSNITSFSNLYLIDNYLNTATSISTTSATTYTFTVTNAAGSWDPARFKIVFIAYNPLQVNDLRISGSVKNNDATIQWTAVNENNMAHYELQRSDNGSDFATITNVTAMKNDETNVTYEYADKNLKPSTYQYRIMSVANDRSIFYSNVLLLTIGKSVPLISIYPNPVVNGEVNLSFENVEQGIYQLNVYALNGQLMHTENIAITQSNMNHTISLKKSLASGLYKLSVKGNDIQQQMQFFIK